MSLNLLQYFVTTGFVCRQRVMRESRHKIMVPFFVRRGNALGQAPTVVFRQAVLPLQEVSNGLRFDAHLHSPQARQ